MPEPKQDTLPNVADREAKTQELGAPATDCREELGYLNACSHRSFAPTHLIK